MASALYLEQYLESLQHLPVELQRNFKLMRELDKRAHGLMSTIDLMVDKLLPTVGSLDSDTKKEKINDIQSFFNKAKEFGDDKVQLAIQTYELVDKHIRRLDSDLTRFDSEIQEKALSSRASHQDANVSVPSGSAKKIRNKGKSADKSSTLSNKKEASNEESAHSSRATVTKKTKKRAREAASGSDKEAADNTEEEELGGHPSDVLDMPVDPNEPTYCLCQQVSYGEMIGCDNPECPIEWFHFACVDLKIKPKGKWYCPKCTQDRKRK